MFTSNVRLCLSVFILSKNVNLPVKFMINAMTSCLTIQLQRPVAMATVHTTIVVTAILEVLLN